MQAITCGKKQKKQNKQQQQKHEVISQLLEQRKGNQKELLNRYE